MFDNTITVILLILIVALYLLPTLVAYSRDHPHRHTIALLNILFGWTLIVWIVVFVWAKMAPVEISPV